MSFENLVVEKVVLHEVFKRRHDGALVAPRHAGQLVILPADAMGSFTERVVDAMGDASQSMELEIAEHGPDSAVAQAATLVGKTDRAFISGSAKFADKLASAQQAKNLPGGILVVFTGTVGASSRPFVAIIKAEKQSGFRERGTAIQYLTDLFLTPASKLYKIGFFTLAHARLNLPEGWRAHVYDSHMTQRNREGAAKYFYGTFLGCRMPENSAYLTRSFFENTRDFIRQLSVEPEVKDDLLTSLYTYLKVDHPNLADVMAQLEIAEAAAPSGHEYVHGMTYWAVIADHFYQIQHVSMQAKAMEEYLTWLLRDTGSISATEAVLLQWKFDRSQVGDDDLESIQIGGLMPETIYTAAPDASQTEVKIHVQDVEARESLGERVAATFAKARQVIVDLIGEVETEKIIKAVPPDAALDVRVNIGFRAKKRKLKREVMSSLEAGLRNIADGEIVAKGRNGEVRGNDARLSMDMNVRRISETSSLLDPEDALRQILEVHRRFLHDSKIDQ